MAGLHVGPGAYSVRCVAVGDAGHGNTKTSYPQRNATVFPMVDSMCKVSAATQDLVHPQDSCILGGMAHPSVTSSRISKRMSHSTCNAETSAGYKVNETAQLLALRMSGIILCGQTIQG